MAQKPNRLRPQTDKRDRVPSTDRCNAKLRRKDTLCKNYAGHRTDHSGVGRCARHGGFSQTNNLTTGLQSTYHRNSARIQELQAEYAQLPQPLSLYRELAMQRALMHDYVERYDATTAALLAWYADKSAGLNGDGAPPPERLLDITSAARLVESISRIVERIEKIRSQNAIARPDLLRILGHMARIVELHIADETILERIKAGWQEIQV